MLHTFINIPVFQKLYEKTSLFKTRVQKISDEVLKSDSVLKGEKFENFVESRLFPDKDYVLVKRTDNFERNKNRFSESTNDPDFIFRNRTTGIEFCVEAKYRSKLGRHIVDNKPTISWCKDYQLERYRFIDQNNIPVLIAVGLGGVCTHPRSIYLFRVRKVRYYDIYEDVAQPYILDRRFWNGVPQNMTTRIINSEPLNKFI